ncbi:MAG: AmmeMemoRadiSam system radical SAM enzyme [candidate division Zixibacteria bacterium]|nr:AmmeMemoRadiSam system radical SAM enzyme [candidate division Zixibacteria bacterium]NIR67905.1 AmmeMemoRadiSam system radical SAM enzyme [candidate division Zixibacteria bacterium]NIS17286.1 AmmeMemoRadiSam system radical SAM enzyme [candidate division Zixibacteria bacterium]NIS49122.1 AmmeMemoRadiSam system radical SAM enzyme [candidate division Zixibacteria bacterium]NIT53634.1 AmmeMemoRadiSam system radical SAM enzyme [candidate division Zixibacteria bacterium]
MKRRTLIKAMACGAGCACLPFNPLENGLALFQNAYALETTETLSHVKAMYYKKLEGTAIECELCPRHCLVTDLERGYCGVRENQGGEYYTLVHSRACAMNIDPIEKKPLFHFHPGTAAFSIATAGCNVNCKFCQNWDISQVRPEQVTNVELQPDEIVRICRERSVPTVAYTYSEPVVFYEYMHDTCIEGQKRGIKNVMITGGYIEKEPLKKIIPLMDAIKVDLKSYSEQYYKDVVNGELQPVLDALKIMHDEGIWLELVYLVVPTMNDGTKELTDLCQWIKTNLSDSVPIHFTRFHPTYLMTNLPPTPVKTLEKAFDIARQSGLKFPYIGNVPGHSGEHTYCPGCGEVIIERRGFRIGKTKLKEGKCGNCGTVVPGVWA